ncbi:MAG: NADH-quinone oxidoreductase subunit N [Actinobacteria bacterium]|nr:NADH-quinone oxidoreductase subunit N [Actinomycetota bacterium]
MIHTPHVDWFALSTILVLLGASFVALLAAVLVPRSWRRPVGATVSGLAFAGGLVTSIWLYVGSADPHRVIANSFYRDRWTALAQAIICGVGLATTLLAVEHVPGWNAPAERRDDHIAEFFALLLACAGGMAFFVGAANLMVLFLGLEWFSIALYVMCAIDYDLEGSLEAGLKYLVVGSFGSAALLFGSALVYAATGRIDFVGITHQIGALGLSKDTLLALGLALIIAGLGFKSSSAPFHMWTPDVYQGAPTTVTAFMAAATKVAAFALAMRVMQTAFPQDSRLWTWAFAGVAVASLVIGNFAALVQKNVKRILAYSSISHAGFMLIGLSVGTALGGRALMYYLIPYAAMAFGSFAVVAARERELGEPVTLENLAGFGWERPFLGVAMWFFLFAFAGLPLGGGFVGKFYVFSAAYRHGWTWLVIVGVLATLVSLYYYLGIVRAMYMRPSEELRVAPVAGGSPPRDTLLQVSVALALAVSVGSLFAVSPLIHLAKHAASALPF